MGRPWNEALYWEVILKSEMESDLQLLAGGSDCEIGERGSKRSTHTIGWKLRRQPRLPRTDKCFNSQQLRINDTGCDSTSADEETGTCKNAERQHTAGEMFCSSGRL